MVDQSMNIKLPENLQRRRVLQSTLAVMVVGAVPAVSAVNASSLASPNLTGKLFCNIADPVKTLVLTNSSSHAVVVNQLSKSALMFDGSIVDCNNAFLAKPVSIPANQTIEIRFSKRNPQALFHRVEDYQRVQTRVKRLSDGTRVIPFNVLVQGSDATFV